MGRRGYNSRTNALALIDKENCETLCAANCETYVLLIAVCVEPDPALVKWFLSLMADNRTSDVSNG